MRVHSGEFLNIHYETTAGEILIRSIEPHPETYLRAGADHLISDLTRFRRLQLAVGISEVVAIPDRSATRLTLEEAGWRGAEVMRFAPDLPVPVPSLDMGRPGAFAPDTLIRLETGDIVPAGSLHPGIRIADGGRIEEVMLARARQVCRLGEGIYGALNRVRTMTISRLITEMPEAELVTTSGTDLVWLVTERSRVRSGAYLFEDMWGSATLRHSRRISQAEVIAALNAADQA